MQKFIGLLALIFVGIVAWRIGAALSSDAISMAVGVFFGVLASIPTVLLVLVGDRRSSENRPTASRPQSPTIVVHSTTQHITHNHLIIPPAVQRGMIQRGGDQVTQNHKGHWLILRGNQVVGKMIPRQSASQVDDICA